MVTINRTRKDSCENAHVLLPLIGIHAWCSQVQSTTVVHWDKHALRLNVHQLCKYTVSNKHRIISHRHRLLHTNFLAGGVPVGPDEEGPWAIRPWNYFRSIPTYVITVRYLNVTEVTLR